MVSPRYIGGYPVSVVGLQVDDVLFFNGKYWVNVPKTTESPTVYSLDSPTFTEEQVLVFDGLPVMISNLAPGDVLCCISYDFVPRATTASFIQEVYTNVAWSNIYSDLTVKPENRYLTQKDTPATLMADRPTLAYTIERV